MVVSSVRAALSDHLSRSSGAPLSGRDAASNLTHLSVSLSLWERTALSRTARCSLTISFRPEVRQKGGPISGGRRRLATRSALEQTQLFCPFRSVIE